MDIKFICPSCNQHIAVDASMRGRSIKCPACSQSLKIPATSGTGSRFAGGSRKKIVLGIVIATFVISAGIAAYIFWLHQQPGWKMAAAKAKHAEAARRLKVLGLEATPAKVSLGSGFVVSYTVAGLDLKGVELWRAHKTGLSNDDSWRQIGPTISLSGNGPVNGEFPTDTPDEAGDYWYGIHVLDHTGNWKAEGQSGFQVQHVVVDH
jgi:hypothetical protein